MSSTGVLLINLGTPDDSGVASVRRYLRQFLSDPRVLDIAALARALLLNLVILPFRPKKSARAYRSIWTKAGSPLLVFTKALSDAVQKELGDAIPVRFAMRYRNPSLESVLERFRAEGIERLIVLPLYGQYASSSSGSCLERVYRICASYWNVPALSVIAPFYNHPAFLASLERVARESLGGMADYDHFLFSFHGLPERHVVKSEAHPGKHCLQTPDCCKVIGAANRYCYRAQCVSVARNLADRLGLAPERYDMGFQSRLGRTPWIRPHTDELLVELAQKGVKRLAVMIPSFTADCLETLEEIAIRGRQSFLAAGGRTLHMVPALNDHPAWVTGVVTMIHEHLPA